MPSKICQRAREPPSVLLASKGLGIIRDAELWRLFRCRNKRHSFVVNRILDWYRAGINPQDRLPYLTTYLGHRDIHSTLVYITVTQDLLQQAGERFRVFGAHCLHATEGRQP